MQRKIIFIHGMGVGKYARGMFTEISENLLGDEKFKDIEPIFTDLNFHNESGDIVLNTLDKQADIIKKVYEKEKANSEIILICHSQGCVVATLAGFFECHKIFFLAPPMGNDIDNSIKKMSQRPGTIIDTEGESVFARSDGSKTIIPKEYWEKRKGMDYMECYKNFSDKVGKEKIKIVIARQDEVVANDMVEKLEEVGEVFHLDTDHNFTYKREELVQLMKQEF